MHHWTELRTQPWESVWRLPTPCTPVGSQRALSYIIEMLSHEAVHSRTVFNLRDVLMAFWDSLFLPDSPERLEGALHLLWRRRRKRERKKKKSFFYKSVQRALCCSQPACWWEEKWKSGGEGREASLVSSNDWPRGFLALKQESCLSLPQIPNWSSEVKCKFEPT